jgi:hypothetical protein
MAVQLEGLSMSHQELCRGGLFVRDASVSDDGRVSSGRGSAAVRAAGASWREGPAGGRFDVPADLQLRQAREDDAAEPLLFLRGRVVGTDAAQNPDPSRLHRLENLDDLGGDASRRR